MPVQERIDVERTAGEAEQVREGARVRRLDQSAGGVEEVLAGGFAEGVVRAVNADGRIRVEHVADRAEVVGQRRQHVAGRAQRRYLLVGEDLIDRRAVKVTVRQVRCDHVGCARVFQLQRRVISIVNENRLVFTLARVQDLPDPAVAEVVGKGLELVIAREDRSDPFSPSCPRNSLRLQKIQEERSITLSEASENLMEKLIASLDIRILCFKPPAE